MILYESLADNKITVTEKCVEIADSCNMCGKCDYQCYFLNEMRNAGSRELPVESLITDTHEIMYCDFFMVCINYVPEEC